VAYAASNRAPNTIDIVGDASLQQPQQALEIVIMPRPQRGHYALIAVVCLSSAWPMEGHGKLKIGKKESHDSGDPWPHLEVESLFKGQGHQAN